MAEDRSLAESWPHIRWRRQAFHGARRWGCPKNTEQSSPLSCIPGICCRVPWDHSKQFWERSVSKRSSQTSHAPGWSPPQVWLLLVPQWHHSRRQLLQLPQLRPCRRHRLQCHQNHQNTTRLPRAISIGKWCRRDLKHQLAFQVSTHRAPLWDPPVWSWSSLGPTPRGAVMSSTLRSSMSCWTAGNLGQKRSRVDVQTLMTVMVLSGVSRLLNVKAHRAVSLLCKKMFINVKTNVIHETRNDDTFRCGRLLSSVYVAVPGLDRPALRQVFCTLPMDTTSMWGIALHLPTSFPKQILTPSRFKFILLINNGIDWKKQ